MNQSKNILEGPAFEKFIFLIERGATVKEVVLQKGTSTAHITPYGKVTWEDKKEEARGD